MSAKNRRSNNNTLINIARITKKAKVSTYNEKGKEGPKREVGKFCKNKKTNKNFYCNNNNNKHYQIS